MDHSMNLDANELSRLELQAHEVELQLEQRLALARQKAEQVATRLAVLQAFALQAGEDVLLMEPPRVDFETEARGQVLQARHSALQQRTLVANAVQASLDAIARTTAEMELSLAREAQRLAHCQRQREVIAQQLPPGAKADPAASGGEPERPQKTDVQRPRSARERRQSPRVVLCTEVDMASDTGYFAGFSTDISDTGIFVASTMTPPPGSVVELRFRLPCGTRIAATGTVRWTREVSDATPEVMPGAGVQFLELTPQSAAAISAFVATRYC